jgi:hypothetical protein
LDAQPFGREPVCFLRTPETASRCVSRADHLAEKSKPECASNNNIRGALMALYRAYNVDSTGATIGWKGFESANDNDACDRARSFCQNDKWLIAELWEGDRKIAYTL